MILLARCLVACLLVGFSVSIPAQELPRLSHRVVGGEHEYTVRRGDFLIAIGARFGVDARLLAAQNGLAFEGFIYPGQQLQIHNHHIVPETLDAGILINIPQRMLFHLSEGKLVAAYPVGLGRPTWPTPEGKFRIVSRETNKTWIVPESIQEEMRREGQVVRKEVPPGPDNPLGKHWLGISFPGCGIHSTIAPSSVFLFRSHGCVRLHPDDAAELFGRVRVGTRGRIVYQPVLLAVVEDGRIFLEIHRDVYGKGVDPASIVRALAEAHGLSQAIDWTVVDAMIEAQHGVAQEVGRMPPDATEGHP